MARKGICNRQRAIARAWAAIVFWLAGAGLAAQAASPPSATFYTVIVRPHDTVSMIAERYGSSVIAIARLNRLREHIRLYPGEVLRVPATSRRTREAVLDEAINASIYNYAAPPRPIHVRKFATTGRISVHRLPPPVSAEVTDRWSEDEPYSAPQEQSADANRERFVWPVRGRVISPFGRTMSGERNDGINIAATAGTPIRAAAAGTVSYAGDELRGYGNLILIQHDDGYVTAYAHAESLSVARGDHVEKGQVIGLAGATGDVDRPQLHFEIRRGVKPVNPRLLLASRD